MTFNTIMSLWNLQAPRLCSHEQREQYRWLSLQSLYIIDVSRVLAAFLSRRKIERHRSNDRDSWDLHCLVLLHILLAISRGTLLIFGRTSALISIYTTSTGRDDNSTSLQLPWILIVTAHNGDSGVSLFGLFQNAWHNIIHVRMISFTLVALANLYMDYVKSLFVTSTSTQNHTFTAIYLIFHKSQIIPFIRNIEHSSLFVTYERLNLWNGIVKS